MTELADPFDSARRADTVITDEEGIRRERTTGRYMLPVPGEEQRPEKPWTRATTFAKSISDTYVLDRWGLRMAIKGMTMDKGLYALVAATPLPDHAEPETFSQRKKALDGYADRAKDAAGAKIASSLGTALHAFTEQIDAGGDPIIPEPWDGGMAVYRAAMLGEGFRMLPNLIERIVLCQRLGVAGKFDRIVQLTRDYTTKIGTRTYELKAGDYVIADLKTGRDLKYGWNEIAIQLAIYANSDGIWDPEGWRFDPLPEVRKDIAIVFHLPVDQAEAGEPVCTVIDVDIEQGWAAAELCEAVRRWRAVRRLSTPRKVYTLVDAAPGPAKVASQGKAGGATAPEVVAAVPNWAERIAVASSRGELSAIRAEALAVGAWGDGLLRRGMARLAELDRTG